MAVKTYRLPLSPKGIMRYYDTDTVYSNVLAENGKTMQSYNTSIDEAAIGQTFASPDYYAYFAAWETDFTLLPAGLIPTAYTIYWHIETSKSVAETMRIRLHDWPAFGSFTSANWLTPAESAANTLVASLSMNTSKGFRAMTNSISMANLWAARVNNRVAMYAISSGYESSSAPSGDNWQGIRECSYIDLTVDTRDCNFVLASRYAYSYATPNATWATVRDTSTAFAYSATPTIAGTRLSGASYNIAQLHIGFTLGAGIFEKRNVKRAWIWFLCRRGTTGATLAWNQGASNSTHGFYLWNHPGQPASTSAFCSKAELEALTIASDLVSMQDIYNNAEVDSEYLSYMRFELNAAGLNALATGVGTTVYFTMADTHQYLDSAPTGDNPSNSTAILFSSALVGVMQPTLVIEYEDVSPFHGSHF